MLLKQDTLRGIADGSVTLQFRRWKRPTVKAGGTLLTSIGQLRIDAVDRVELSDITDADARAAGFAGRDPLSVSTDKLGIVALRGVRILERLRGAGADRSGGAGVYEVYPAGALALWGLPSRGYKGTDGAAARQEIVAGLAPHLDPGGHEDRLADNDDDLDAVICALLTGLARFGHTIGPPPEHAAVAAREGWIHLPAGPLDDLGT